MAEDKQYSEQTQAIIERLKVEGRLTRNGENNSLKTVIKRLEDLQKESKLGRHGETHSLKAIGIEIQKFSSLFETISTSTLEQTKMLRTSLKISEEQLEAQMRAAQFAEDDAEVAAEKKHIEDLERTFQRYKLENDIEDEKERAKQRQEGKGIFNLLSEFGKKIKSGLWWIAALTAGFFVLKGFIDELTGGAFTKVQDFLVERLPDLLDGLERFVDFVTEPNVLKTLGLFAAIATPLTLLATAIPAVLNAIQTAAIFKLLRGGAPAAAAVGAAGAASAAAAAGAAGAAGAGMLIPPLTGDRAERRRQFRDLWPALNQQTQGPTTVNAAVRDAIASGQGQAAAAPITGNGRTPPSLLKNALSTRNILLTAAGASLIFFGALAADSLSKQTAQIDGDELMNTPITNYSQDATSVISTIAGAATLGALFGPKGMIAGAIIGGVYTMGVAIKEKVDDMMNDVDPLTNQVQMALREGRMRELAGEDPLEAYRKTKEVTEAEIERLKGEQKTNQERLKGLLDANKIDEARKSQAGIIGRGEIEKRMEKRQSEIDDLVEALEKNGMQLETQTKLLEEKFPEQTEAKRLEEEFKQLQADLGTLFANPIVINAPSISAPQTAVTGGSSQQYNQTSVVSAGGSGSGSSLPSWMQ